MSKRRERTPYQKQRDAFIKRVKRYNESHGTHFKYDFPTYQELKDANVSDERINEIADLMKEVRNEALVEQFEQGGAFAELYEHRVSSTEGALYNKGTGKLGAKLMDTYSLDKGGQTYPVDPLTGELITTKTELFLSRLGFSDYETPDDTYEIVNGRANGQYDPQKSDKEIQREIEEVEDEYPTYNEDEDDEEYYENLRRDEDEYDEDYWTDNMSISDILKQEQYNEEYKKQQKDDDYFSEIEDYDAFEAAFDYAWRVKQNAISIIEKWHTKQTFIVSNASQHTGIWTSETETINKFKNILNESFSEGTNTSDSCYDWASRMENNLGRLQDLVDIADDIYKEADYLSNIDDIAFILNDEDYIDDDISMDLHSGIALGEDYDEWQSNE